jgi:membrane protein
MPSQSEKTASYLHDRGKPILGALVFVAFAAAAKLARRPSDNSERRGTPAAPGHGGDPHGRSAESPGEIPRRGWWDILLRVKDEIGRNNLSLIAAGVAFYGFLAIPSGFAALVALYGLAFDPTDVTRQIQALEGILPGDAVKLLSDQLSNLTAHSQTTLGVGLAVSFALAVWSARSATSSLIIGLNIAYKEEEKRSFVRFQIAALGLTLGAVISVALSLALIAVLPAIIDFLPLGPAGKTIAALARWPILVVLVMLGLAALYRYAPCRAEPRWRWVSWGAVAATILWIVGSALFSVYVSKFAAYDKTYGSLGAVVVMLMWLYLSVFAVLVGGQLNAEIEHQTVRDSTTGRPQPLGDRGAKWPTRSAAHADRGATAGRWHPTWAIVAAGWGFQRRVRRLPTAIVRPPSTDETRGGGNDPVCRGRDARRRHDHAERRRRGRLGVRARDRHQARHGGVVDHAAMRDRPRALSLVSGGSADAMLRARAPGPSHTRRALGRTVRRSACARRPAGFPRRRPRPTARENRGFRQPCRTPKSSM